MRKEGGREAGRHPRKAEGERKEGKKTPTQEPRAALAGARTLATE